MVSGGRYSMSIPNGKSLKEYLSQIVVVNPEYLFINEVSEQFEKLHQQAKPSHYGDHISEDIVLFKDQKTNEIIGIGIFNFKQHTKDFTDLRLKLPVKINLSALNI